jgi:hypothetical protein
VYKNVLDIVQAFAAVWTRFSLFWVVTQFALVVVYNVSGQTIGLVVKGLGLIYS